MTTMFLDTTAPAPSASTPAATGPMEFKPVEGGSEMQSGVALMTEAYAVIWLLVFVLVFATMRKAGKLDARIDRLAEEIAKARDGGA